MKMNAWAVSVLAGISALALAGCSKSDEQGKTGSKAGNEPAAVASATAPVAPPAFPERVFKAKPIFLADTQDLSARSSTFAAGTAVQPRVGGDHLQGWRLSRAR